MSVFYAVMLPAFVGLLASLAAERLVQPGVTAALRRPWATLGAHIGSWAVAFAALTALVQRPLLAATTLLVLQVVLTHINNIKWRTLNEPFVAHDFQYFIDALRFPRLYVPFFGITLAVSASIAGAFTIAAFMVLEPALMGIAAPLDTGITVGGVGLAGGGVLALSLRGLPKPSLEPTADLKRLGLFSHLWAYALAMPKASVNTSETSPFRRDKPDSGDTQYPNVVLVQSESFFDPRAWTQAAADTLLANWDQLLAEADTFGELDVPCWGANTTRTEAAVLTGLGPEELGIAQFEPYQLLKRQAVPNLVEALNRLGYASVAIHPYPGAFYQRDRVFSRMGFDQFIDGAAFSKDDIDGQYVSDAAVTRMVDQVLDEYGDRPVFVFVITMENHGPLHLEQAPSSATEVDSLLGEGSYSRRPPHDLLVYLRHLANADQMVVSLRHSMRYRGRSGILGWYGDHVPILPQAYARCGTPEGHTHYAVWSTARPTRHGSGQRRIHAKDLGPILLDEVFVRGTRIAAGESSRLCTTVQDRV